MSLTFASGAWAHSAYAWSNVTDPVIWFTVEGSADASLAPHSVTLSIDTGSVLATGFVLKSPDVPAPGLTTILPSQLPWTTTVANRKVTLQKLAGQPYQLIIEKLPNTVPRGTIADVTDWYLQLNGLTVPNNVATSIDCLDRNLVASTRAYLDPPPQVAITSPASAPSIAAGGTVAFTASATHPDKPLVWTWTINGGTDVSGAGTASASARYVGATGSYAATASAQDSLGQTGSASRDVNLTNTPPAAPVVTSTPDSASAFVGSTRRYSATTTDEFPAGDPLHPTFTWAITNGTPATATGPYVDVTFTAAGPASVSAIATDNVGQASAPSAGAGVSVLPRERLEIPSFAGLPFGASAPVMDGNISDGIAAPTAPDVGWKGATRVEYADGTTRDLSVQALNCTDGSANRFLYLAFEVRNDPDFSPLDAIVLAFRPQAAGGSPDGSAAFVEGDAALVVHPLKTGASGANLAPDRFELWRYKSGAWVREWNVDSTGALPTGFEVKGRVIGAAMAEAWDLEMKIPMRDLNTADAATWPDLGQNFLLYWDLCRVDATEATTTVAQFTWPRQAPPLTGTLGPGLLKPSDWSAATTDPAAVGRGVFIASPLDFGVRQADGSLGSTIKLNSVNTFMATISNSSLAVSGGGSSVVGAAVPGVTATFRMAAWGTGYGGATWQPINAAPASSNPAIAPTLPAPSNSAGHTDYDQPGQATAAFEASPWTTAPGGNTHQCIYVELRAAGDVRIVNNKYFRNMDFVSASRFEDKARVDLVPERQPTLGLAGERFLLRVSKVEVKKDLLAPATHGPAPVPKKVSTLVWTAHSMRDTGAILVIRERRCKVVEPAGSFGYYVRHVGPILGWNYVIKGVKPLGKDLYSYELPARRLRSSAGQFIEPIIEPVESKLSAGLRAGTALPLGPAAPGQAGLAASLDLGLRIDRDFWLDGSLSYAGFTASGAGSDTKLAAATLGLSWLHAWKAPFEIRARVGGGWAIDLGSLAGSFCVEAGFGAELALSELASAEFGAAWHRLFDAGATQYATVDLGLELRF
jgi:hypothetical protein